MGQPGLLNLSTGDIGGHIILCCGRGGILYIVGCLAAPQPVLSRCSLHPFPSQGNQKCLQMCPDVPWGAQPPWFRTSSSHALESLWGRWWCQRLGQPAALRESFCCEKRAWVCPVGQSRRRDHRLVKEGASSEEEGGENLRNGQILVLDDTRTFLYPTTHEHPMFSITLRGCGAWRLGA